MTTANDILAAALDPQMDKTLVIDADLRTITIPPSVPNLGVMSDDSVLWLHFRMPSTYGTVDLTQFKICINYENAQKEPDKAEAKNVSVEGGSIKFSWEVGRNATEYQGTVRFSICLKKEGTTEEFNTTVATLPVLEGLETSERVVQRNPDILEDVLNRLNSLERKAIQTVTEISLPAANWDGDASPYRQVVDVPGITNTSKVNLEFSIDQLVILHDKDVAFVAQNENGTIVVYSLGTNKPANDYVVQATITEVRVV